MPRSRGAAAPRRPVAAPAAKPAAPANTRQASTAAAPPAGRQAPMQQPQMQQQAQPPTAQGPGLFGQMASTAAGVAVGSSIGHAVGGWFSGGSSQPAESSPQNSDFAQQHTQATDMAQGGACTVDVNNFRSCMDQNQGSLTICGWYLDQLKACQQAAGQY